MDLSREHSLLNSKLITRAITQKSYKYFLQSWIRVSQYQYSKPAQHLEVTLAVHVKETAQGVQDVHAKQLVYFARRFVTKEGVQTKSAHYLVNFARNAQMLLRPNDECIIQH